MKNSVINSNREKHHIYDQNGDCVHRVKKAFYTPLFQKVSRKKTKRGPFLDGQVGSIFNKKYAFSENLAESKITGIPYWSDSFFTAFIFSKETGCPPEVLQVIVIKQNGIFAFG